jgi:hypothetical protein
MNYLSQGMLVLNMLCVTSVFAQDICESRCRLALTKCVANGKGFSVCQWTAANCKTACSGQYQRLTAT